MKDWTPKALSIVVVGIFVISLLPLVPVQSDKNNTLQALITQVQRLEQSSVISDYDFKVIFSDALSTIQSVAGLKIIISTESDNPDSKTINIVINTKVPYLLLSSCSVEKIEYSENLLVVERMSTYKSHIIPPDTPPPTIS